MFFPEPPLPRHEFDCYEEVLIALRRIMRAIDLHSKRLVQRYGVTGPQLLILKKLQASGETTVGELAKQANLSQATVTDILDRLEKRCLAQRTRSAEDKRRVLVKATNEGLELLHKAPSLLHESFVEDFKHLPDWEQAQLLSSLQRVAAMMNAEKLDVLPVLPDDPFDTAREDLGAVTEPPATPRVD